MPPLRRVVEYVFFFGLLFLTGYMVWLIAAPFISALALSAIIVTICQPVYHAIRERMPRRNKSLAALLTTLSVLVLIILPIIVLSSMIVGEVVNFYQELSANQEIQIDSVLTTLETRIELLVPGYDVDLRAQLLTLAESFTGNLGAIFAGTLSTVLTLLIAIIGSFYFFRDGQELLQLLIKASPLPDHEDEIIFARMGKAVRAVATGTLLIALIQGTLVTVAFLLVGFEHAILWGSMASVGALMPGVGTSIVTIPAVIYLFATGQVVQAVGLFIWSAFIVGLVDNFVGPYLIGRGNNMHPFIILIAVLGGLLLFGPIGFVVGPVIVTLFLVLLEIYNQYIVQEKRVTPEPDESHEKE